MNVCAPEYWLWLAQALGAGAVTDEILTYFESPKQMYEMGVSEWRLSGVITPAKIEALLKSSPKDYLPTVEKYNSCDFKLITPDMQSYPPQLLKIRDIPLTLFVRGDETVLTDPVHIAIVGTREASRYGIEVAQRMSFALAKSGVTIVSGGALGVDSEAHAGAMLAKGRTVAVLGCGLDTKYLMENAALRRAIARYGAVVSEYAPTAPASRYTFPIRNRIISALSLGTLVIEAGEKSGSLITARLASEQGKDVFAVPGDIVRSSFTGTNKLIHDGAKPVFSPEDVLEEYTYRYGEYLNTENSRRLFFDTEYVDFRRGVSAAKRSENTLQQDAASRTPPKKSGDIPVKTDSHVAETPVSAPPEKTKKLAPDSLTENARRVYELLGTEKRYVDELVQATGLPVPELLSSLTELELYGLIRLTEGKGYVVVP